ncbi:uncharacterized protein LOC133895777 [Phragmites australis]|uniref:uncharacterized protein LOC133895777 n=1 Tax=Phragmites australis TaxID=29695 RepID=UPI002D79B997|nr:uncharacterized protein LOC133895777 [Phragmites australis]
MVEICFEFCICSHWSLVNFSNYRTTFSLMNDCIQGNLQHEFTGSNCVPLECHGVRRELMGLLRYMRLCMFFSKKPYEVFLAFGVYGHSDILIRKSKARGATSAKDRLTAAAAAEFPFHHSVLQEGRKSNLVVGHVHRGMVATTRWIADQTIPCLSKAVEQFPDYKIKILSTLQWELY